MQQYSYLQRLYFLHGIKFMYECIKLYVFILYRLINEISWVDYLSYDYYYVGLRIDPRAVQITEAT